MPAVPPTPGSVSAIERAFSSICLKASGVENPARRVFANGDSDTDAAEIPAADERALLLQLLQRWRDENCNVRGFTCSDPALQGADRRKKTV